MATVCTERRCGAQVTMHGSRPVWQRTLERTLMQKVIVRSYPVQREFLVCARFVPPKLRILRCSSAITK